MSTGGRDTLQRIQFNSLNSLKKYNKQQLQLDTNLRRQREDKNTKSKCKHCSSVTDWCNKSAHSVNNSAEEETRKRISRNHLVFKVKAWPAGGISARGPIQIFVGSWSRIESVVYPETSVLLTDAKVFRKYLTLHANVCEINKELIKPTWTN